MDAIRKKILHTDSEIPKPIAGDTKRHTLGSDVKGLKNSCVSYYTVKI